MANSSSPQVEQWLKEGVAAAKRGDKARARDLLVQVTEVDEYNEQAWLWLSGVVESDQEREICLENVLTINPDNSFAQQGLDLLRQQSSSPPPAPDPLPRPQGPPPPAPSKPRSSTPPSPVVEPDLEERLGGGFLTPRVEEEAKSSTTRKWGDRPRFRLESVTGKRAPPPEPSDEDVLEGRVSATATPAEPEEQEPEKKKRRRKKRRRQPWSAPRWLKPLFAVVIVVGAIVGALFLLKIGPFTPPGRGYAVEMRPLLDEYDAWLNGPYKRLQQTLRAPCGPDAFGYWAEGQAWTRYDTLVICSHRDPTDCEALQTFCGGDLEAEMAQVEQSADQALTELRSILDDIDAIEQLGDAPQAHQLWLACAQERLAELERVSAMAQGEEVDWLGESAICQMFPQAKEQLRQYLDDQ